MPPFGLYTIPTHHLNAQSPLVTRPVYSSLDFVDHEAAAAVTPNDGLTDQSQGTLHKEGEKQIEKEKKKERRRARREERREQKRQSENANAGLDVEATKPHATPVVTQAPAASNSNARESINESNGGVVVDARLSKKKRKRKSVVPDDTSLSEHEGSKTHGLALGTDFLEGIKSAMGDLGPKFDQTSGSAQTNELPIKRAKLGQKTEVMNNASKAVGKATENTPYTPTITKAKAKNTVGKSFDSVNTNALNTPFGEAVPSSMSPYISIPKRTPVPLPHNSDGHPRSILRKTKQNEAPAESRVLVTETPPSRQTDGVESISTNPIPFRLPQASVYTATQRTTSGKEPALASLLSPTTEVNRTIQVTPVPLPESHKLTIKPGGRVSLTTSNLMRYTEPLNDEPKAQPHTTSVAASTATSTSSSTRSMSIKEAFARVPKPYTRSGAEIDPFVVPEARKRKPHETHDEANLEVFVAKFRASRNTVNFSHEQEYLTTHLSWHAQNDSAGPLPCLGQVTGCTPKREIVLRLYKEDTPNALKVFVTTDHDTRTLSDATQRSASAETFLQLAIAARIPVPLGRIEGTWTLFCPKYSDTHVDKYGFGKRTLTIHSIAGFKAQNAYMARLSIPPRSMLYTILSFSAPPHASFRTTTLRTAVEGYKMDVVFLGNGYLQLRVDLNLLLRGKPTETAEGKPVYMEFLGVHEEAVKWKEERDELEEVGRRLFAKYDGTSREE